MVIDQCRHLNQANQRGFLLILLSFSCWHAVVLADYAGTTVMPNKEAMTGAPHCRFQAVRPNMGTQPWKSC